MQVRSRWNRQAGPGLDGEASHLPLAKGSASSRSVAAVNPDSNAAGIKVQFTPPGRLQTKKARAALAGGTAAGNASERGYQCHGPLSDRGVQRGNQQFCEAEQPSVDTMSSVPPSACTAGKRGTEASVPFLVRWINYLCGEYLGWTPLTPENLVEDLKTGLVLCRVVERLVPNADFSKGINMRPKTKKTCVHNIDRALQVVWKQGINSSQMCNAEDFYDGNVKKVTKCLLAIFEVLQLRLREIRLRAREVVAGIHAVLQDTRPLSAQTLSDPIGFGHHLLSDFADGHRIMCLLVAAGAASQEDFCRLRKTCVLQEHWLENSEVVNNALSVAGCPVVLSPSEWTSPPAPFPDTLMFQIYLIWHALSKQEFDGRRLRGQTRELAISEFLTFVEANFVSIEEACNSMTCPGSNRISREVFSRALRSLHYPGDVEYIWDCLDPSAAGWVNANQFLAIAGPRLTNTGAIFDPDVQACSRGMFVLDPECPDDYCGINRDDGRPPTPDFAFTVVAQHAQTAAGMLEGDRNVEWISSHVGMDEEARIVSPAEERSWLFAEDARRQLELYELGRISVAQQATEAAAAAARAAEAVIEQVEEVSQSFSTSGHQEGINHLGPTPTTCVDAWVLQTDGAERRMWVQTSVVGRPVDEEEETVPPALVLEVRERCIDGSASGKLRAQIDAEKILAVETLGGGDSGSKDKDLRFVVRFERGADFLGGGMHEPISGVSEDEFISTIRLRPSELRRRVGPPEVPGPSIFHAGSPRRGDGCVTVSCDGENVTHTELSQQPGPADDEVETNSIIVRAGASLWQRREASHFFDEFRILLHFTSTTKQIMQSADRLMFIQALSPDPSPGSQTPPASPRPKNKAKSAVAARIMIAAASRVRSPGSAKTSPRSGP